MTDPSTDYAALGKLIGRVRWHLRDDGGNAPLDALADLVYAAQSNANLRCDVPAPLTEHLCDLHPGHEGPHASASISGEWSQDANDKPRRDPDYSPAYQDEYQRLWHESQACVSSLEAELAEARTANEIHAANFETQAKAFYQVEARAERAEAALRELAEYAESWSRGDERIEYLGREARTALAAATGEAETGYRCERCGMPEVCDDSKCPGEAETERGSATDGEPGRVAAAQDVRSESESPIPRSVSASEPGEADDGGELPGV